MWRRSCLCNGDERHRDVLGLFRSKPRNQTECSAAQTIGSSIFLLKFCLVGRGKRKCIVANFVGKRVCEERKCYSTFPGISWN